MNHPPTLAWQQQVLANDRAHRAKAILDRGRTDFDRPHHGLTPDDKVTLYCYHYLQMHAASTAYVFDRAVKHHGLGLSGVCILVDFGCGPLTLGVALAWHDLLRFGVHPTQSPLQLRYLGIESSRAMTTRAIQFAEQSGLFDTRSTFAFLDLIQKIDCVSRYIDSCLLALREQDAELILNFSYSLSSKSLMLPGLAEAVCSLLERYPRMKKWLVYQDADYEEVAQSWATFRDRLQAVQPLVQRMERLPFLNTTDRQGSAGMIRLHYALLCGEPTP